EAGLLDAVPFPDAECGGLEALEESRKAARDAMIDAKLVDHGGPFLVAAGGERRSGRCLLRGMLAPTIHIPPGKGRQGAKRRGKRGRRLRRRAQGEEPLVQDEGLPQTQISRARQREML